MTNEHLPLLCLSLLIVDRSLHAQPERSSELYQQIMRADSLLFETGFNNCNFDALYRVTHKDLEFYHDETGHNVGQEVFVDGIRKNICSLQYRPKRKFVEESNEIHALRSNEQIYGAVQTGVHEFYAIEEGKEPYLTSTAKFTHLWTLEGNEWKLKRVLSYDHQVPDHNSTTGKKDLFENTDDVLSWLQKNKVPALALAKIENNEITRLSAFGELYKGKPAPVNAIFNVASLTKPVVAMLALTLVNTGDWDLDAPLHKYWVDPDVQDDPNNKKITTRHILSHRSGFLNWRWEHPTKKLTFDFEPGTDFNYSGEGFEYLRKALESKFKKPLNALADSLIFSPLGMHDTKFYWDGTVDKNRFAKWHNGMGENEYETYKSTGPNAADDLLTTVEDYAKFARFVMRGANLKPELFKEMTTQQNGEQRTVIGLGWEILPSLKGDEYAIMHTGGDDGVNTIVITLPKTGEALVAFTNGDNGKNLYFKLIEEHLSLGSQILGQAQ